MRSLTNSPHTISPPPKRTPNTIAIASQNSVEVRLGRKRYPSGFAQASRKSNGRTYARPLAAALNTSFTVFALLRSLNEAEMSLAIEQYGTIVIVENVFHSRYITTI